MEIVITGRHTEVTERFRRLTEEKLTKVSQLAPRTMRVDVELSHERNPRQAQVCKKVEITLRDRGPVIRAEAEADDPFAALDLASAKLLERLRRSRDRRKVHRGRHTPASLRNGGAVAAAPPEAAMVNGADLRAAEAAAVAIPADVEPAEGGSTAIEDAIGDDFSPVVIRTKDHTAAPMTLDQALYEMELVGHDFYLFLDAESGRPSVVYRRRGWNYGVIRLHPQEEAAGERSA